MIHTDERFSEAVEEAVGRIEERTHAEVVVVAAKESGHYRDVRAIGASLVTFALLVVLLYIPMLVTPLTLLVECLAAWVLTYWILGWPAMTRLVTSDARMARQVREAAAAEFHEETVHGTPDRTGLLVYVSALEGRVVLLPDAGIEGRVPPGTWKAAQRDFVHDDLDHFLHGLQEIGEVLAAHVPPDEAKRVIDLPNAPRVRP